MLNQAQAENHEKILAFSQNIQVIAEDHWTLSQRRLLEVIRGLEDKNTSIRKICQLAGYAGSSIWCEVAKDDRFVAEIQALGFLCSHNNGLRKYQQRLLAVLRQPEHRTLPGAHISRLAGYKTAVPYQYRHSIATDMIEQGIDIYTVKEFLGHKSLAMTEKYVKVYLSSLKAKYGCVPPEKAANLCI